MDFTVDPNLLLSQSIAPPAGSKKGGKTDPAALRKVCDQFEAILFHQMFKAMRATIPQSGLLDKDSSFGFFQDLMDFQVSQAMAKKQGGGLADSLFKQLNIENKK
jgi:flagellar protein FlgJ